MSYIGFIGNIGTISGLYVKEQLVHSVDETRLEIPRSAFRSKAPMNVCRSFDSHKVELCLNRVCCQRAVLIGLRTRLDFSSSTSAMVAVADMHSIGAPFTVLALRSPGTVFMWGLVTNNSFKFFNSLKMYNAHFKIFTY